MAQRRFVVRPDQVFETADGQQIGVVSDEALLAGAYKLATVLSVSGGVGSIVVGREPTEVDGEMLTTGAVFEWKDRTDARPQPEQPVTVVSEPTPLRAVEEPEPEAAEGA